MNAPSDPIAGALARPSPAPSRGVGNVVLGAGVVSLLVMTAWAFHAHAGVEAARWLIRATARSSLLWFLLAYGAQSAFELWPGFWTATLRRHRRQWGRLLVISHGIHALAIVVLAHLAPALFETLSPPSARLGPVLAYVVLVAMGLTSFDRSAHWLGRVGWTHLHTWGSHYLWLSFVIANAKRVSAHPEYALPVALLALVMALRMRAWRRRALSSPRPDSCKRRSP
jgi:sulfoxide reductase heme-binding subunit YedZ